MAYTQKIEGNELVIRVKLTDEEGESASGKSITVASTHGNLPLGGEYRDTVLSLNVYKKNPNFKKAAKK